MQIAVNFVNNEERNLANQDFVECALGKWICQELAQGSLPPQVLPHCQTEPGVQKCEITAHSMGKETVVWRDEVIGSTHRGAGGRDEV